MKIISLIAVFSSVWIGFRIYDSNKTAQIIKIEIPNGYEGFITIIKDESIEDDFPRSGIKIDDVGKATVSNFESFYDWHKIRANYENGNKIRYVNNGGTGGIALWPFSKSDKVVRYFLGEEKRKKELWLKFRYPERHGSLKHPSFDVEL